MKIKALHRKKKNNLYPKYAPKNLNQISIITFLQKVFSPNNHSVIRAVQI